MNKMNKSRKITFDDEAFEIMKVIGEMCVYGSAFINNAIKFYFPMFLKQLKELFEDDENANNEQDNLSTD